MAGLPVLRSYFPQYWFDYFNQEAELTDRVFTEFDPWRISKPNMFSGLREIETLYSQWRWGDAIFAVLENLPDYICLPSLTINGTEGTRKSLRTIMY